MFRVAIGLLFLTALSQFAEAGVTTPLSKQYAVCLDKAQAADPMILDCMSDEYERQDKRLNVAYRKLMGQLSGDRKKEFQEVQRLWLKFAEANCGFYHDPNGGTAALQMSVECSLQIRAQRAAELESLADMGPG